MSNSYDSVLFVAPKSSASDGRLVSALQKFFQYQSENELHALVSERHNDLELLVSHLVDDEGRIDYARVIPYPEGVVLSDDLPEDEIEAQNRKALGGTSLAEWEYEHRGVVYIPLAEYVGEWYVLFEGDAGTGIDLVEALSKLLPDSLLIHIHAGHDNDGIVVYDDGNSTDALPSAYDVAKPWERDRYMDHMFPLGEKYMQFETQLRNLNRTQGVSEESKPDQEQEEPARTTRKTLWQRLAG